MPTVQGRTFFCAEENRNPSKEIPEVCMYQCRMCKDKEMKMAKEQPLYLLIVTFNDGKPQHLQLSNDKENLISRAKSLLEKDSTAQYTFIHKPILKIERSDFKITIFD